MSTQPHTPITLATKVTFVRILGLPVFILLLIYYQMSLSRGAAQEYQRMWALIVFVVIALTDALDGYLARSRNEITRLGSILDPLADKILLLSGIILLTRPGLPQLQPQFPVLFTLIVISRDVVLVTGSFIIHWLFGHVDIRPRLTGKIATFFQMASVIWALAGAPVPIFMGLVWIAAAFTIASGAQYAFDAKRQVEKHSEQPH